MAKVIVKVTTIICFSEACGNWVSGTSCPVLTFLEVRTNDKVCNHDVAYCSVLGTFNESMGMEMNVEKTKVMRISRQPSPVTITIDQKQLENVKCFKYLGSVLTANGRCTCEIKSRIAMAKAAFNKKKNLFTSKLDLHLRKKLVKC